MPPPTGLVLAAGTGSRLSVIGPSKPLVEVAGRPLIGHVIGSLGAAGLREIVVVVGHRAAEVEAYLATLVRDLGLRIATVHNADYLKPNGWSALAARGRLQAPFILSMSDHIYAPGIVGRLTARPLLPGEARLAVDRRRDNPLVDLDDVTRVFEKDGHIRDIGKGIARWNAFDTGVFYAGDSFLCALAALAEEGGEVSLSAAMRRLAQDDLATTADIGSAMWIDVDDPAAKTRAEDALRPALS